jgi:mRNA interferase RelE/StbE
LKAIPRPPGVRKIAGRENLYRVRVGEFRVIYEIEDDVRTVRIFAVRKRDEAYR